jgi:phosphocarrier protein
MQKIRKEIIVKNKQGLHARPAALFVQVANKFDAEITILKDSEEVNGKSIMGILLLGAERDSKITIIAEGRDAEQAIVELEKLLSEENN